MNTRVLKWLETKYIDSQKNDLFWNSIGMLVNLRSLTIIGRLVYNNMKMLFADTLLTLSIRGVLVSDVNSFLGNFPNLINFEMNINQEVKEISVRSEKLETIRVANCPQLITFKVNSKSLVNISCDSNPRLEKIDIDSPNVQTLRFKGLPLETEVQFTSIMPKLSTFTFNRIVYLWPTFADLPKNKITEYGSLVIIINFI